MARPPHLALAVAALAAVVVPLRSAHAFDAVNRTIDLQTLAYVSRIAWSVVAIGGFAAVGFAYATRNDDDPRRSLVVAGVAALVGVLAGNLVMVLGTDVYWGDGLTANLLLAGTYSLLDAALFALLTLGGVALAADGRRGPAS